MKVCTVEGCEMVHRARGLCATHYNQAHQPGRHAKVHERSCAVCGASVLRKSSERHLPTCSYKCRRDLTFGISEPIPEDHPARWFGSSCPWSPPKPRVARFVDRACDECGEHFITDRLVGGWRDTDRLCSRRCRRKVGKRARRHRENGTTETFRFIDLIGLWLALDKRCAYCNKIIANPEPDHVVPLSRGGAGGVRNLLPSCRPCNTDKNDMTPAEWAVDRASRGKEPRTTDYVTGDQRARHLIIDKAKGLPYRARDCNAHAA